MTSLLSHIFYIPEKETINKFLFDDESIISCLSVLDELTNAIII